MKNDYENSLPYDGTDCPCGCKTDINENVRFALQYIKSNYQNNVILEHGAVCSKYFNKFLRKSFYKPHKDGNTIIIHKDTFKTKDDVIDIIRLAYNAGFNYIGIGIGLFDNDNKCRKSSSKQTEILQLGLFDGIDEIKLELIL